MNIRDVIAAGARGAAVISAVLSAPDIRTAAAELISAMQGRKR
jgi:thiamine monophosphate synthase